MVVPHSGMIVVYRTTVLFSLSDFPPSFAILDKQNQGMNKAEQREAAKELFMLSYEQNKIARIVDVTDATISKWVNEGLWREERAKKFSLNDSIVNQTLELIDYQLMAIRANMKELKEKALADGKAMPLIGKGEIDALSKMFASVKQKDITWTHYVNVCRELADFIATKDPDFAKSLMDFTDAFLMNKKDSI